LHKKPRKSGNMPAIASKKKKSSSNNKKAKVLKYLSTVRTKDIFAAKNKKAEQNLKRAGLI
jgi:hypothetical protein